LPRVDSTDIYQLIYEKGHKISGYNRYWRYYNEIEQQKDPLRYLENVEPIYWGISMALKKFLIGKKDAKILEIGSGLGYLTYALRNAGFTNAYGLEIAQEAVERANKRFGPFYIQADLFQYAKEQTNNYDVIYLSEVIEHIEDSMGFIETSLSLLKDGGALIMTTPNKSFYPDTAIWATDNPPVHCWWFSEESFKYIAECFDVAVSFIDYSEYYRNHELTMINKKSYVNYVNKRFIFDAHGELIRVKSAKRKPGWRRAFKSFKRRFQTKVYPMISKNFEVSGKRTTTMCVTLIKKSS
jgi:SAM-dependent methyltransferase